LVVAGLTLGNGGDDSPDTPTTATTAAGATGTTSAPQPDAGSDRDDNAGSGGASAKPDSAASDRDAGKGGSGPQDQASTGGNTSGKSQRPARRKQKARTKAKDDGPPRSLAELTPSERRKLHKDLYDQNKDLCQAYGPEEMAKSFELPTSDPEKVAKLYAEKYEQAAPSLILPVQQGCLAGLRQWSKRNG
jgi:hypothetical protein